LVFTRRPLQLQPPKPYNERGSAVQRAGGDFPRSQQYVQT